MIRPLGFVATLVLAVCLLGVGIAGSETAKSAKKTEAMTQVPTPTPMLAGKPGGTLNVMLREDLSTSRRPSPWSSPARPASTTW